MLKMPLVPKVPVVKAFVVITELHGVRKILEGLKRNKTPRFDKKPQTPHGPHFLTHLWMNKHQGWGMFISLFGNNLETFHKLYF
jgi:hypothetical protein